MVAYTATAIGQSFDTVATAVAIFDRTESAAWVGAIAAARLLPYVIVPGLAGVVAGRVPRRALLMGSAIARAVLAGLMALAFALDAPPLTLVLLTFVMTACGTPTYPALAAAIPDTLPAEELAPGNGLLTSVENIAWVVGPALGGLVLAVGSPAWAMVANALVFVVAFLLAVRVREARPARSKSEPVWGELSAGIRAMRGSSALAAPVVLLAVVNVVYGAASVALVPYADDVLDAGSGGFGMLNVGLGIGAFIAVLWTNRLASARNQLLVLGAVTLLGGVPYALLVGVSQLQLAILLLIVAGAGAVAIEVLTITLVQRETDRNRVAPVIGILDSLIFGALFVGSLLTPVLLEWIGVQGFLVVIGALLPVAALVLAVRLSRSTRHGPEIPLARVELLANLPWLSDALVPALQRLAIDATEETVAPGEHVIVQGAAPDDFFVIVSGRVAVVKDGEVVALLGAGDGFGEIGLLEGVPRTASVVARWPTVLLRVRGDRFVSTVSAVAPTAGGTLAGGLLARLGGGGESTRPEH